MVGGRVSALMRARIRAWVKVRGREVRRGSQSVKAGVIGVLGLCKREDCGQLESSLGVVADVGGGRTPSA